jgi:hypothetical protein
VLQWAATRRCVLSGVSKRDVFVEIDRTVKQQEHVEVRAVRPPDHRVGAPVGVCRDEDSAREFCRAADREVIACHSYAGEYPGEWDYAGRARMFFVAERATHEGSLEAYALPQLPPEVRVTQADGDRRAAECQPRALLLLGIL